MKEYKFVKEFSECVKRIYREMDEANLPSPTFKKQAFMTIATIKNNFIGDNVPVTPREDNDINIIIKVIKDKPEITKTEIAKIIGKSAKTVQRTIKENAKIKFIGNSKNGHWEILSDESNKNDY